MTYKQTTDNVVEAYAIVNNDYLFSVHPTKAQAKVVFKECRHPEHFKIIRLKGLNK